MAAPTERGRGIFGLVAPTRERTTTPVLPRPDVRSAPAPEPGKPPKTRKQRHTGRNIALAGLALAGAVETTGAVITEQTNNQPISAHTIPADLAWPWNLGKSAIEDIQGFFKGKSSSEISTKSDVFDPTANKQTVKAGVNAVSITPEKLLSIMQNAIVPGNEVKPPKVNILTPAKLKEGETLDYSNHIVPLKPIDAQGIEHPIDIFLGVDYVLTNRTTDIPLFVDRAEIFQLPPLIDKGKSYLTGLVLKKTMPDGNPLFFIVESPDDIRNLEPEESIKNAPIVTEFRNKSSANVPFINDAREGIVVSINRDMVPVILRAKPNTHLFIRVVGYKAGLSNLPISLITITENNVSKVVFSSQN